MRTKLVQKRWDKLPDLSTPKERIMLDKLIEVRSDMAPLKITSRNGPETGQFDTVTTVGRRILGCYCIDMIWIKQETKRCRKVLLQNKEKEAQRCIGAHI